MKFNVLTQCLLLVLFVVVLYHATFNAELISIDDPHIVATYGMNGSRTLSDIIIPRDSFYYRPLIELTYYFDGKVWDMVPRFLHLENVLIHAINTILVYFLALQVILLWGGGGSIPFVAATLFACHPVNCEAVAWFSGRTDPLAAIFVLLGSILLLKWLRQGAASWSLAISALAIGGFGVLAKETAGMFFPLLMFLPLRVTEAFKKKQSKTGIVVILLIISAITLFVVMQWVGGGISAFTKILNLNAVALDVKFFMLLKSLGYYIKKLFLPFPLNFATVTLHWSYCLPGIAFLGLLLFGKKDADSVYLLSAVALFLLPPLFVAIAGVSWTPVAERYLYLPSVFFSIYVATFCERFTRVRHVTTWFYIIAGIVIASFSAVTYVRTLDWQNSRTILTDSVEKSPEFGDLRNDLAARYIKDGELAKGRHELRMALELQHNPHIAHLVRLNMLTLKMKGKSADDALIIINQSIPDRSKALLEELQILRSVLESSYSAVTDLQRRKELAREIVVVSDILFARDQDPYLLYRNGQHVLFLGDRARAADYFSRAYVAAPQGAAYKDAARTLAEKLKFGK